MWFNSQLLEELQETNKDVTIYDCLVNKDSFVEHIQDFIDFKITKENYKILIDLCDFLIIDNVDAFIDKIIELYEYDYSIIYEFEDFYKYNTKRLIPMNRYILNKAIKLYCKDHKKCFYTYGFSSFWDISKIEKMDGIFNYNIDFNGDISNWDVSNVKYTRHMFYYSAFNGDISKWDVSNVKDMYCMFERSDFNQNISNWDVSNVEDMCAMFNKSKFNQNISKWNVSNVKNMSSMFEGSDFNQDI